MTTWRYMVEFSEDHREFAAAGCLGLFIDGLCNHCSNFDPKCQVRLGLSELGGKWKQLECEEVPDFPT